VKSLPRATYRIQFHSGFSFNQAAELAPYLRDLGVSHLYSSPCLKAARGSTHGYDVVDHSQVNPEAGGEEGLRALWDALEETGLGFVLDIVPNHMAVGTPENRWWWDVLENGPSSPYAAYFDVDWNTPEDRLANKILLPVLEDHYGRVLEAGKIQLIHHQGRFTVRYADHRFPTAPRSLAWVLRRASRNLSSGEIGFLADALGALPLPTATDSESIERRQRDKRVIQSLLEQILRGEVQAEMALDEVVEKINGSPDRLDRFLEQQNYRLAYWRAGAQDLGYRRFFDIDTLAGLRVERGQVFSETHELILKWHREGRVNGLRVDHPDGLRDPEEYLDRLRNAAAQAWVVVEKILHPGERLPKGWPVEGSTGYDFLYQVDSLFIHPAGEKALTEFYAEFTGEQDSFSEVVVQKKRQVLVELLGSEINCLADRMVRVCERHRRYRDYTRQEIQTAIQEVVACFEVYRSYVQPHTGAVRPEDSEVIRRAVSMAAERNSELEADLFGFIQRVLLLELHGEEEAEFVLRLQQLTGPAAAKGVEDTAFYCYNRLIALNEVGGDPGSFGMSVEAFHAAMLERARREPHAMLTTSTHDTKRSEDVRARLALLTEIPKEWSEAVRRWARWNERHRSGDAPDRNAEYLLYQTLVGAWPISTERISGFMLKAAREAKIHTSWTSQNQAYETALDAFVRSILGDPVFVDGLESFVGQLVRPGRLNSLSQLLIKLTAPGIPDIYQGCELWSLSLVDPDNRRPVDFAFRRRLLSEMQTLGLGEVLQRMDEGLPKLWVTQRTLKLRRAQREIFDSGAYTPAELEGEAATLIAFWRGQQEVLTLAPRFPLTTPGEKTQARLRLPHGRWRHTFTDEVFGGGEVSLERLLASFPVALLWRMQPSACPNTT